MKTFEDIKNIIQSNKNELKENYGLITVGIFGTYVKGLQTENSDIDILGEVARPMCFVKFLKLENKLSHLLVIRVELVTKKALKFHIGQKILKDVKYV